MSKAKAKPAKKNATKAKGARLTPIPAPRGMTAKAPTRTGRPSAAETIAEAAPNLSHISPGLRPLAVRTGDLAFLPENPMDHDDRSVEEMQALLREWGQLQPLIVNRRPTPNVVVSGNKRLRAALLLGWEWIAVEPVDLDPERESALAIEMNRAQDQSWNKELLAKAIHRIGTLNLGEIRDAMMSRLAEAKKLIPKDPPEPRADPASEPDAPRTVACPHCGHEFTPGETGGVAA